MPLLLMNEYHCGDESDELEDSVQLNISPEESEESNGEQNQDYSKQNEPEYELEENDQDDDLGDKIDYNDNLSKISTLATSNEAAFNKVSNNVVIQSKSNNMSKSKSKRRVVTRKGK
jgi:hypothetical protein